MGTGSFTSSAWSSYRRSSVIDTAKDADDIYRTRYDSVEDKFLPKGITREACDSDEHPNSTPIIIGLDVTGSMSDILTDVAKKLGDTVLQIMDRKCVSDPEIMFAAIDDYTTSGNECLQVTQFESDIRIAEQLNNLKFQQMGGGNGYESYADLWYFAANHTKCDAFKNGRRGIIITVGDDGVQKILEASEILNVFGDHVSNINTQALINEVARNWEVFNIVPIRRNIDVHRDVIKDWESYIGTNNVTVKDINKIPEVIVSLIQSVNGTSVDEIVKSWDGSTAVAVEQALKNLVPVKKKDGSSDVVVF